MPMLEKTRMTIAANVRAARLDHRWRQHELAQRLAMSQGRLSQLERGRGSFSAEQVVVLAQLFNIPVSELAGQAGKDSPHAQLQNALARLGARDLVESDAFLPSDHLADVNRVTRETLVLGAPRLLTGLAPVIVRHIDRMNLLALDADLRGLGLLRRLGWLADNVLAAIELDRGNAVPRETLAAYRRVEVVLQGYVRARAAEHSSSETREVPDVLDATIRSQRTVDQVRAQSSAQSRRWNIITGLTPEDFAESLEAARAGTA